MKIVASIVAVASTMLLASQTFAAEFVPAPAALASIGTAASDTASSLMNITTSILPYLVPLVVVFAVIGFVKSKLGGAGR